VQRKWDFEGGESRVLHHFIRDKLKIEMGMTPKSMLHQIYRRP